MIHLHSSQLASRWQQAEDALSCSFQKGTSACDQKRTGGLEDGAMEQDEGFGGWVRGVAEVVNIAVIAHALTQGFCYRVVAVASVICYPKLEAMNGNCQQVGAEGNLGSGARSV